MPAVIPTDFPYTELPGRRRGLFVSGSVWLGSDHFLSVRNLRFTEEYRRFYFRDIQAIVTRRSPRFYIPVPWLWAALILFTGIVVALFLSRHAAMQLLTVALIAMALWIVFSGIFQSCRCYVQTAVGREEIPALIRLSDTQRATEILSAKIAEIQGPLPADWTLDAAESPSPTALIPATESIPASAGTGMRLALISFLLLLVDVVFTYFHARNLTNRVFQVSGTILILVEAAILVFSLIFLRSAHALRTVRNWVIAGVVFAGATYYISSTTASVMEGLRRGGITPGIDPTFWLDVVNAIGNAVIATGGLAAWKSTRGKLTWPQ